MVPKRTVIVTLTCETNLKQVSLHSLKFWRMMVTPALNITKVTVQNQPAPKPWTGPLKSDANVD